MKNRVSISDILIDFFQEQEPKVLFEDFGPIKAHRIGGLVYYFEEELRAAMCSLQK